MLNRDQALLVAGAGALLAALGFGLLVWWGVATLAARGRPRDDAKLLRRDQDPPTSLD